MSELTKKITVVPSEFREVARVFIPKTQKGLGRFEPIGQFFLCIHYDPTNKLYFVGTHKKVYPSFYSTSSIDAIEFAKTQFEPYCDIEPTVVKSL